MVYYDILWYIILYSILTGKWLEDNHHIFKAELQAILNEPGDAPCCLME